MTAEHIPSSDYTLAMSDLRATIEATPRAALTATRGLTHHSLPREGGLAVEATPLSEHNQRRFWSKVSRGRAHECWVWRATSSRGYGRFSFGAGHGPRTITLGAHRFAYELLVGPIPPGLHLDHLCRRRACVNPAHLEPVTLAENNVRALPEACKYGHSLSDAYSYPDRDGTAHRYCRTCAADRQRAYRARKRAA